MKPSRSLTLGALIALTWCSFTTPAIALVNPTLQPVDLFDRHSVVVTLTITAIDINAKTIGLDVNQVTKGQFASKRVVLSVVGDSVNEAFQQLPSIGQTMVAYAGGIGRGRQSDLLFYLGGEGRWQAGKLASAAGPDARAQWTWTEDLGPQKMYGTFNGAPQRLAEMMADKAAGRAFFPAVPFDLFKGDKVIAEFSDPIAGVAMYDINADEKADLYACNPSGNRAFLQQSDGSFIDATESLGLQGVVSSSCNFADVSGEGRISLLAGGVIYTMDKTGKFAITALLPEDANTDVKSSAFIELNGDGYPDVIVSKIAGGLRAYINPGQSGGNFADLTTALGFDKPESGSGKTGFFMAGDWDGTGSTAIFYSVGPGILLRRNAAGSFEPLANLLPYDFTTYGEESALTGAGCFAPTWHDDRPDVIFSRDMGVNILANVDGKPFDAGQFGNEIVVATEEAQSLIADDFNADGRVDIYLASRTATNPNNLYVNRGYGSFFVTTRYKAEIMPGNAHKTGAGGVAVGDVNGDGVNDILLGGIDGKLSLVVNDTLSQRTPRENPIAQQKVLENTSIITVRVTANIGVVGAAVMIERNDKSVVARRDIGTNISTGCRGPDTANIAIREPGKYNVVVRYSDGHTTTTPIDITTERRITIKASR